MSPTIEKVSGSNYLSATDYLKNKCIMNQFLKLYQSVGVQEQSEYLLALLEKHDSLKRQFMKKYRIKLEEIRLDSERIYKRDDLIQTIEVDADVLESVLSRLDFEETDWDRWTPTHEYVPDYEVAQLVAEEEAGEVFEPFISELEESMLHDDLTAFAKKLISLIHGILCSEINDPYNNLCDPPSEFFVSEMNDVIKKNLPDFTERVFLADDYQNCFDLIFAFNQKHYKTQYEFLRAVSVFLHHLINDKTTATMAWHAITQYQTPIKMLPQLLSQITFFLDDQDLWLKSLESVFLSDYTTSVELLDYYYKNDIDAFEDKAVRFAENFEYLTTDYLVDKVKKGSQFHISLLKRKINTSGEHRYFDELKQYTKATELKHFMDSIHSPNLKVKLYASEGMFDDLEKLIRSEQKKGPYMSNFDFLKAVKHLYPVNPKLAWELTLIEVNRKMNSDRNRSTYNYLAALLKESLSIPDKLNEVKTCINLLFNHKPNLPALKDEFRKAKIV